VDATVSRVGDDAIYVSRLDPAIRTLAVGATSGSCVSDSARKILLAFLEAHRRGLLAHDDMDDRGSHALVAARALLTLATSSDDIPLEEHVAANADNGGLLSSSLHALSAAAEERHVLATAAKRVWPQIISSVLELHRAGRAAFNDRHYGETALSALMPSPIPDWTYLQREVESTPIEWVDGIAWQSTIDAWVTHAAGLPECVDSLIGLLQSMEPRDQADIGLRWVDSLASADAEACARRSWLLPTWLIDIRSDRRECGASSDLADTCGHTCRRGCEPSGGLFRVRRSLKAAAVSGRCGGAVYPPAGASARPTAQVARLVTRQSTPDGISPAVHSLPATAAPGKEIQKFEPAPTVTASLGHGVGLLILPHILDTLPALRDPARRGRWGSR
jgi:hypothetical protein